MKKQNFSNVDVAIPVTYKNLDFVIHITDFDYWPGFPGSYWEPSEPSDIEFVDFHVELDGKIEDIVDITKSDMDIIIQMNDESLFYDMLEDDDINEKVCVAADDFVHKQNDCPY